MRSDAIVRYRVHAMLWCGALGTPSRCALLGTRQHLLGQVCLRDDILSSESRLSSAFQALGQRAAAPEDHSLPDVILITQHEAVYTLGTGSTLANLKFPPDSSPLEIFRTERGGEVTYHGPGQVRRFLSIGSLDSVFRQGLTGVVISGCSMDRREAL